MSAYPTFRQGGFSLIEMMVGIAILGILLSLALPSFQAWMTNSRIRNAAESITNGLQRARAEAVALNTNVAFVLNGTSSSWDVKVVNPASAVDSRSSLEGSTGITVSTTPASLTTVTFDGLGSVKSPNSDGSTPFTSVSVSKTGGGGKTLSVTINAAGSTRMCDPSLPLGSSSSAC